MLQWLKGCSRTPHLLQRASEGSLSPEERKQLIAHAQGCKRCRDELFAQAGVDRALRRFASAQVGAVIACTAACPPEQVLGALADGTLSGSARRQWGEHIAECPGCLAQIGRLRQMLGMTRSVPSVLEDIARAVERMPVRPPVRALVWAPAVALAAVAVVIAALVVNGPQEMITPEGLPPSSTIAQTSPSPAAGEGMGSPVRTTRTSVVRTPSDEVTDESSGAEGALPRGGGSDRRPSTSRRDRKSVV